MKRKGEERKGEIGKHEARLRWRTSGQRSCGGEPGERVARRWM